MVPPGTPGRIGCTAYGGRLLAAWGLGLGIANRTPLISNHNLVFPMNTIHLLHTTSPVRISLPWISSITQHLFLVIESCIHQMRAS